MPKFKRSVVIFSFMLTFTISMWAEISVELHLPKQERIFHKGIELYRAGQYAESLPYFDAVINDSEVLKNRYQLMIYASMWVGNAYLKLNQPESAYNYSDLSALYCHSEPINPNLLVEADSLAHEGAYYYYNYTDDVYLAKAIEIYKKRQRLLEKTLGKNHLWTNGGRDILINLYRKYATELSFKNSKYDNAKNIEITDTIALLGYEIVENLKHNLADKNDIYAKYVYYSELMSLLETLSNCVNINYYYDINPLIIKEVENLIATTPEIAEYYEDHLLRMGNIYYNMSFSSEEDAPNSKYAVDRFKLAKNAEKSYHEFIDTGRQTESDYKAIYDALNGLKRTYYILAYHLDTAQEKDWSVEDFKYDFYEVEEVTDSTTHAEYEKINEQGVKDLLVEVFSHAVDQMLIDCTYDDLKHYEKKLIDTWEQIIDLLKNNDFEKLLQNCCVLSTEYYSMHLLKDDLKLYHQLYEECDSHPEIENMLYYKLEILNKIVELYRNLGEPLYDEISSLAKHTSTREEMIEYLNDYLHYYDIYTTKIDAHRGEIQKLDDLSRGCIEERHSKAQCNFATFLYALASKTGRVQDYISALNAIEIAMSNEKYNAKQFGLDRYASQCKIHIGNPEGYTQINSTQTSQFTDLLTTFKYASSEQRNSLWSSFLYRLDDNLTLSLTNPDNTEACKLAYNSLLYKKGILLASDKNFIDVLNSSQIKTPEFIKLRQEFNRLLPHRLEKSDSLSVIERQLLPYFHDVDYNQNLNCDWSIIKRALRKGESAVEFGSITHLNNKQTLFASVLDFNSKTPQLVALGEYESSNPLDEAVIQQIYNKIKPFVTTAKTVYFAPDGILYNIPFEHIIQTDQTWIRLSSTRNLGNIKPTKNKTSGTNEIALFGGIDYNATIDKTESNNYKNTNSSDGKRELPVNMRDGADNLPYTLMEVNQIDSVANNHGIKTKIYTGTKGSEKELNKLVHSQNIDVLHFATHGFYFTADEYMTLYNSLRSTDTNISDNDIQSDAMTRCGLLLSGANNSLKRGFITSREDDGILTGTEVENLNLHGTKLLVLSACQTGLGDISADGVFGLQRGFKKAGANSILMSLWKVDDKATQILMTKFYEEFLSGHSKYDALKNAQTYLRNYEEVVETDQNADLTATQRRQKERRGENTDLNIVKETIKPFNAPKYWAAFILIDALD